MSLGKSSIDLGIIVRDIDAALAFYCGVLGLELEEEVALPDGGLMLRLRCGESVLKLVKHALTPTQVSPRGGWTTATGLRYFTLSVKNLEEVTLECEDAGYKVIWKMKYIRPGVTVSMVEDPDGNWVEFLATN